MNPSPYPAPFHSAHIRARIVKILLIVGAIATGISFLVEALSLAIPPFAEDQEIGDNPVGAVLALITLLLVVIELVIYLATAVFFCVWLYRAAGNLRVFNSWARLDYSPTLAVGSFFIPFANLVIPYRAVTEVWQKSEPPDEALLSEPGTPAKFPIWWLFWILSSFAGNISMRLSFEEKAPDNTVTIVSMAASVLHVVAAIFAYMVVDAIDKRQEETSRKLKLGKFSEPPPPPVTQNVYTP